MASTGYNISPNNVWLKQFNSLSCAKNNQLDQSISLHHQLTNELDKWFIHHELAEFYMLKCDFENAHKIIASAFNPKYSLVHFTYQWRLYYNAGLILLGLREHSMSKLHFYIAKQLYWSDNNMILKIVDNLFDIFISNQPGITPSFSDLSIQIQNVYIYWQQFTKFSDPEPAALPNSIKSNLSLPDSSSQN